MAPFVMALWAPEEVASEKYVRLPPSNYAGTPYNADDALTGDFDIRVLVRVPTWAFTGDLNIVGHANWSSPYQGWWATFKTDGSPFFGFQTSAGDRFITADTSASTVFGANEWGWVRFTRVSGNLNFYAATPANAEANTWTSLRTQYTADTNAITVHTGAGAGVRTANSGDPSSVSGNGGYDLDVARVLIYKGGLAGGGGTLVQDFDPSQATVGQPASFTAVTGETWSFTGATYEVAERSGVTVTGGTVTSWGGYTYHTFTTGGSLVVSGGSINVDALIVAGGGSGGSDASRNGGAGAGGVLTLTEHTLAVGTYPIVIGDGGAETAAGAGAGSAGGNSTAFGKTTLGGAGAPVANSVGIEGGSGSGASGQNSEVRTGGAATQPGSTDGGFGYAGGNTNINTGGAGGGGAGAVGSSVPLNDNNGGDGGAGIEWPTGSGTYYAGGGGGATRIGGTVASSGGVGGGGNGGLSNTSAATAGAANTGGGAGSASQMASAYTVGPAGGSGVVIVRYPATLTFYRKATGPADTTYANTTYASAHDLGGLDFEMRALVRVVTFAFAARTYLAGDYASAPTGWALNFETNRRIRLLTGGLSSNIFTATTDIGSGLDGELVWLRVTRSGSDWALAHSLDAVTWTTIGTRTLAGTISATAAGIGIATSNGTAGVNSALNAADSPLEIHRFQLWTGGSESTGTLRVDFNPALATTGTPASFVADTGETWNFQGSDYTVVHE